MPEDLINNSYQSWLGCIKQTHSYLTIQRMNKLKGALEYDSERTNQ